jgi:hypothetical protein
MKNKIFAYSFLPVMALGFGFLGTNIASGHGLFGGFSNLSPDQTATQQQTMFQNEAQILGISVDELKDEWAQGKTFNQIVKDKNINQDQLQARMKDFQLQQAKSQIQVLVDKGIITQAQADSRLQFMQNQMQNNKGRMNKGFSRLFHF